LNESAPFLIQINSDKQYINLKTIHNQK